jgi:hypothetical protein
VRKAVILVLVAACVGAPGAVATAWPIDARVSTDPEPSPIALPRLPAQGVAIQGPASVILVDLGGRLVARLPGMQLAGGGPPGSEVLLQNRDGDWLLGVGASIVRPISTWRAGRLNVPDQDHIGLLDLRRPIGSRYEGMVSGHWRFALPSPNGGTYLAQWSGECEVPTAYFARPRARPVPVVGPPVVEYVPESFGLGWTADGRAIVLLPQGACGGSMETPGVYLFSAPNAGNLLHAVGRWRGAAMWGRA